MSEYYEDGLRLRLTLSRFQSKRRTALGGRSRCSAGRFCPSEDSSLSCWHIGLTVHGVVVLIVSADQLRNISALHSRDPWRSATRQGPRSQRDFDNNHERNNFFSADDISPIVLTCVDVRVCAGEGRWNVDDAEQSVKAERWCGWWCYSSSSSSWWPREWPRRSLIVTRGLARPSVCPPPVFITSSLTSFCRWESW